MKNAPFLLLWSAAVVAATAAFVVHLSIRVEAFQLGYELGRDHAHTERLREVRRVLELEVASHKTPERVDFVARQLFSMSEPSLDRIFSAGDMPTVEQAERAEGAPRAGNEARRVTQESP